MPVLRHRLTSRVLAGNPLGDPIERLTVRHEEFDDGHMNIPYRYDVSLPFLGEAILASGA